MHEEKGTSVRTIFAEILGELAPILDEGRVDR